MLHANISNLKNNVDKVTLHNLSERLIKGYKNTTDTISISGLEKGIYMMQVFSNNQSYNQKVVIN